MPSLSNAPVILCVDDDSTGLRFRQLVLEAKGYKVLLATSAQQEMEFFQSSPADLVLMDHLLGRAMGTGMAAALKRLRPQVPIIILTASSSPPEGMENADAFLCKSEGPEALLKQVSALLEFAASQRKTPETRTDQLTLSQGRLASIVESITEAVVTVDRTQRIMFFNKAAETIFRCPAEQALGETLDMFIPERFRASHRGHVERFGHTGVTRRSMSSPGVLVGLRADGEEFPMEATISQVGNGEEKFFTVVLRDITDRNTDKLATMGRMAAAVAHEINGPLDTVANLLFVLEHDQLSDTARAVVQSVQEEVRRIGEIAQLTLGFMRKGARAEVRVTDLIDGILTLYGHRIESLGISIEKRYESAGALVADAGELRQVLSNLIVNASEALAKKGDRLLIHVYDSPDWRGAGGKGVRVVVADNGCGIPQELRHKLFEPFFTTKGEKGTGLGLWASRSLVEKHGGRLQVRSAPGVGTAFFVLLPASMAAKAEVA